MPLSPAKYAKIHALGDAAELEAAAFFRRHGCYVLTSWTLNPYDFAIDTGDQLLRVEVKSTTTRGHVERGGKEWGWTVAVDCSKPFDLLYVHTPDMHFVIPRTELGTSRRGVTVPSAADVNNGSDSKWLHFESTTWRSHEGAVTTSAS